MSEELDHDLELEDEAIFAEGAEHFPFADLEAEDDEGDIDIEDYMRQRDLLHAFGRAEGEYPTSSSSSSGDEDDDENEDEDDPEMDSFIVNDDEVEYEGEPTSEDVHEPSVITVVDDEDDDDDDDLPVVTQQRRARATRTIMEDSDEDEDEDDGDGHISSVPVNLTFRRGWRNQAHVVSSDDDQDDEDDEDNEGTQRDEEGTETGDPSGQDSEDEDDGESVQSGVPSSSAAGEGFSPMQHSMRTGYDYYDDENEQDDDDDGDDDDNNQGWSEGAARWGSHRAAP
jgi:hypothetical protein